MRQNQNRLQRFFLN